MTTSRDAAAPGLATRGEATTSPTGTVSNGNGAVRQLAIPEDIPADTLGAALAYAEAGWFVVPIDPATKHAGSVLGKGWPDKTSRDLEQIVAWFAGTDHGLALHVGRSGAVVLDLDHPDELTPKLAAVCRAAPFQSTRSTDPRRGHAFFALPPGRDIGNGNGTLGRAWGEVRGRNGIVVVEPTEHSKAAEGGRYRVVRPGPLPTLPGWIADQLPGPQPQSAGGGPWTALRGADAKPCKPLQMLVDKAVAAIGSARAGGGSRHEAMLTGTTAIIRSAEEDYHSGVIAAVATVRAAFVAAIGDESRGEDPGMEFDRAVSAVTVDQPEIRALFARWPHFCEFPGNEEAARIQAAEARGEKPATAVPGAEVEAEEDPDSGDGWQPVDLVPYLVGDITPEVPTLMPRDDGVCLLYPGRVHSLHGEPESGKSLLAQYVIGEALKAGTRALYLDYEDSPGPLVERLRGFGVGDEQIKTGLVYISPERAPVGDGWDALLDQDFAVAVVDGVSDSFTLSRLNADSNADVVAWSRSLPRMIADRTGAAVVQVDHVTKSSDSRGRFAIGGQAKLSQLTGPAFMVEVREPIGRGRVGVLTMRLAKDRLGYLRGVCGEYRKEDRTQLAAEVTVNSLDPDRIIVTVAKPAENSDIKWRPTGMMQRMSLALEASSEPMSKTAVLAASGGQPAHAQLGLDALIEGGFVGREDKGKRGTMTPHWSVKPYREPVFGE